MKESSNKSPQKLEDIFRAGMEGAEVTPSARVWERIEQGLDQQEAGYYKERIGWYKSLAAACMVLVICAATYLFYDINTSHTNRNGVASQSQTQPSSTAANSNPVPIAGLPSGEAINPPDGSGKQPIGAGNSTVSAKPNLAPTKPNNRKDRDLSYVVPKAAEKQVAVASNIISDPNKQAGKRLSNSNDSPVLAEDVNVNNVANDKAVAYGPEGEKNNITTNDAALEPLVPVISWAGQSQKTVVLDSIRAPKALPAVPPSLAMLPQTPAAGTDKPRAARWSFSAKYAPQYFNQNIALTSNKQYPLNAPAFASAISAPYANVGASIYTEALNKFDKNTESGYSYNSAVAAGYALNEHWTLETGFNYTQNVANTSTSYIFNNSNVAARYSSVESKDHLSDFRNASVPVVVPATALLASLAGQQDPNTASVIQTPAFETQYRYRLVGIPVKINYQTSHRKSFYFASVGLLTNLLVQAHVLSESNRVPDIKFGNNTESPFRTLQVAAIIAAGKGFRLSKSVNFRAGLEGTQYLNSLAAHPEYLKNKPGKPYTIGVAFSSSYTLGK